jgi:D-sorbitol dehydrogenase (acceptor)
MQQTLARTVKRGSIGASVINMASQAGRRGEALVSHYCATKAGRHQLHAKRGVGGGALPHSLNAISPGVIATPMWDHVDALFAWHEGLPLGEKKKQLALAVPLSYRGSRQDVAGAAVFLVSDAAFSITAQTLNVDGGSVMS